MDKGIMNGHIFRKRKKSVSIIIAIIIVVFTTIAFASIKYGVSPLLVTKKYLRFGILSTISFSTSIYDPSEIKKIRFAPENQNNIDYSEYVLIEEILKKENIKSWLEIRTIKNEIIKKSGFHFSYQPYNEPRLIELRKKYKLHQVISAAKDEFESMVLLRNWARSQFRRNDYQPILKNFDALTVLERNYRNTNNAPHKQGQFRPCHFFPLLCSQVMLSMGYQARVCQISFIGYDGHGLTEVWSNQYGKWVTMDADLNLHYEKDGIPQNLLEIHNERYTQNHSNIQVLRGIQKSGDEEYKKEIDIDNMIQYHSYFRIADMRNDWLTNHYFKGHPRRSDQASLFWMDEKMPPIFHFYEKTNEVEDFYWTLNQTEILVKKDTKPTKTNILALAFKTFTPNFKHYEIWIDDAVKTINTDSFFTWELHPNTNKLQVCSVNQYGIKGISSYVELFVD